MNFIINNKGILSQPELNNLQVTSDQSVYEVFRVIDGIVLFLEDHFERLMTSVKISGSTLEIEFSEFRQKIVELVKLNQKLNGNIKFVFSTVKNEMQWSFSFIPHRYPDINDYHQGVSAGLLFAERENPNAKIIQNNIREIANQMIADEKLYEVLLVDRNGKITEGSRTNVFFVKHNKFYTAPATKILEGITRQKVMECLTDLGYQVVKEAVEVSEISDFDAIFLTGTSPKVLPVKCIDAKQYAVNNYFVVQLISKYDSMIERYIGERKK